MNFKNPCLKCLVRPCCENTCHEYNKFDTDTFEISMKISLVVSLVLIIITFIGIIYITSGLKSIAALLILWIFTTLINLFLFLKHEVIKKEDFEIFNEDIILITILAPYIFWILIMVSIISLYSRPAWERNGNIYT
jgi:hypothetical protein